MIKPLKCIAKILLPQHAFEALSEWWVIRTGGYGRKSFAQEAEDLMLKDLLSSRTNGFYVDVGAYHPVRYSNTWIFYQSGWRGINVDALPGSMKRFRRLRPRDINVECAVSSTEQTLEFYAFPEPAFNTFSRELAEKRQREERLPYSVLNLRTRTLRDILSDHVPAGQAIDFMTIDIESHELDVLKSNDWTRFRPQLLLVECLDSNLVTIARDPVVEFLAGHRYEPVARTPRTVIFKRRD